MSLTPDVERALEEAFLGATAPLDPTSCEDYFAPPSRTTALDEVERFLQASDGEVLEATSARFALSAKGYTKSGAYASPLARRTASSSSSSSSPQPSSSDSPFHERIAEARSRYRQLAHERSTPRQQDWGSSSSSITTTKHSRAKTESKRSYTFQPSARGRHQQHAPPAEGGENGAQPVLVAERTESSEGGSSVEVAPEGEAAPKDGEVEFTVGQCPGGPKEEKVTQRKIIRGVRRAKAPSNIPREKFSKLRIECGGVEESLMEAYMMDKKIVHLSQLMQLRRSNGFKSLPGNWVTFGILADKSDIRDEDKGGKTKYAAWDLADLQGNMISLFLLNDAAAYLNHEAPATVFAILNPEIIDARGGMSIGLTVNQPTQVLKVGKAADFALCSALDNGKPCTSVVDKSVRERCLYHMQGEYSKVRSSRGELNSVVSSPASRMTLKEAQARSQNNLSKAIFYVDGLELQPRGYTHRRSTAKRGKNDEGSELLASPEISSLLKDSRNTAGARNLKRLLGLSEEAKVPTSRDKRRMVQSSTDIIHPNHPALLQKRRESLMEVEEELVGEEGRKRKTPRDPDEEGEQGGPLKKRRKKESESDESV